MDKFKIKDEYMNKGVIVKKYSNSISVYGIIIDFIPKPFDKMTQWLFVDNRNAIEYRDTENKKLLIPIDQTDIEDINYQIDYPAK